jgi:uncharacterized protein YigE (DUF2233 family)
MSLYKLALLLLVFAFTSFTRPVSPAFISFTADPSTLRTFWKDDAGKKLKTFDNLEKYVRSKGKKLLFAMNCGMYTPEYDPVGLYIEKGKQVSKISRCHSNKVNFCMQPQGVFYLTADNKAGISTVQNFSSANVQYASQSAPVVLQDGKINKNLLLKARNIRNGIGVTKGGKVVMAVSEDRVTFVELAQYFLSQGCTTAMYFDGAISQAYKPGQASISTGEFGAMIAAVK